MPPTDLAHLLELAEKAADEQLRPNAAAVDQQGVWPAENLRALLSLGFGPLVIPAVRGGSGHGLHALARVTEALGRGCTSTALCYGMHCVGAAVLGARPSEEQQRRFVQPIVEGRHLTTLALSEPGTGSDFWLPETRFELGPDGLRVRGRKSFVTNGGYADSYIVSGRSPGSPDEPGVFSCAVVPSDAEGLTWGEPWRGLGMRGNAARTAELDLLLPSDAILGEEGDQLWYVFQVVAPFFLAAMAGTYLGAAAEALELTRRHLMQRVHTRGGASLAENAILQHRFGALWARLEASRRLLLHATLEADTGGPEALPALFSAKADVAETAVTIANEAMTLGGGAAYRDHAPVGRILRDVRAAHVMAPTTDTLRTWTGRLLLEQPLLVE